MLEWEIAAKTDFAAREILNQLENRDMLKNGKIVLCVLPTRDAFGKITVLGKNASDAMSRALLSDPRVELATELSIGATDCRVAGTLYEMEGRRVQIAFRCGNNPDDPYSKQRNLAMAAMELALPSDPRARAGLMRRVDVEPPATAAIAGISPAIAVRSQRRDADGTVLTESMPLSGGALRSGEQFQIEVHGDASEDVFVYLVWRDTAGEYFLAWPSGGAHSATPPERLDARDSRIIPSAQPGGKGAVKNVPKWFALDDQTGMETVHVLANTGRKDDVDSFLTLLASTPEDRRDALFKDWAASFAWETRLSFDHLPAMPEEQPVDDNGEDDGAALP